MRGLEHDMMMRDLRNSRVIYFKAFLFLVGGFLAAVGLLIENPTAKTALLVALCVWCFCRAYYFAFYVIEHYVDPQFRFAGLWSFVRYLIARRGGKI